MLSTLFCGVADTVLCCCCVCLVVVLCCLVQSVLGPRVTSGGGSQVGKDNTCHNWYSKAHKCSYAFLLAATDTAHANAFFGRCGCLFVLYVVHRRTACTKLHVSAVCSLQKALHISIIQCNCVLLSCVRLLLAEFWQCASACPVVLQRSAAEWEATFESCYELFGGTTATDELDELSSECAHICNIARANLQHQRDEIDAMLTKLVPLFDPTALLQQQEGADAAAAAAVPGVDEGMHDALDALYAPVIALCKKGKRNASQLQLGASEAVAAAAAEVAADAAASPKGHQQQQQRSQDGEAEADRQAAGSSEVQQQVDVHDPQLLEQQRVCVVLQEVLQSVRSAAVKSLAEVAAGQIMVLLTMARSIGAVPR